MLLLRQIRRALEAKSDHTVPEDFFLDMLDEQFSEEESLRQMETAVTWGRYAELFDFDAARRRFVLPDALEEEIAASEDKQVNLQHPLARTLVTVRTWPFLIDLGVAACALAVFFAVVSTGVYWFQKPIPVVPISSSISALPLYAFYSIVRMAIAYLLSLAFAITYGYIAAYNPRIEPWMVAVLDILQSIPVLSFLPPVVLAMVSLVPGHQMGIEMARDSAHLHRPGVEPRLQLLFLAQDHSARDAWRPRASIATPAGSASGSLKCPSPPSAWCGTRSSRWPAAGSR